MIRCHLIVIMSYAYWKFKSPIYPESKFHFDPKNLKKSGKRRYKVMPTYLMIVSKVNFLISLEAVKKGLQNGCRLRAHFLSDTDGVLLKNHLN